MSDDFSLSSTERTEIDGPIKVTEVVGVDIGKVPLPNELDGFEEETETIWVDVGDTYKKEDDELGEFDVSVETIFLVEETGRENWYELEVKYQPIVPDDADEDMTRTPLIKKQSIRSFAQEAVNLEPIGDAGKTPEERDGDVSATDVV